MVIGETTKKIYHANLKKLKEHEIIYEGNETRSVKSIVEYIRTLGLSESSVKSYLSAIKWDLIDVKKIEPNKFTDELSEYITNINNALQNKENENEMTSKQKNIYVNWDDILATYDELKKKYQSSFEDHKNFVLLSLYVLFPPRRVLDYSQLFVSTSNNVNINKKLSDHYDVKNYYVRDSKQFIFNNWKGKSNPIGDEIKFKQQHFTVPNNLCNVLNKFIDKYKIEGSLLNMTEKMLSDRIKKIFKKYQNKSATINIIRHSFITNFINKPLITKKIRLEIAEKMGHSLNMQLGYYKIDG